MHIPFPYKYIIIKIIAILSLFPLIFLSNCSSDRDSFHDIKKPYLIHPVNSLMTSSRTPFFHFRNTNHDIDGIYYDFILSSSQTFSEIIYYQNDIIPEHDSYIIEIIDSLEQGRQYYFKSTARIRNSNEHTSSDTYSIYIENIKDNTPNLIMTVGDSITDSAFPGNDYADFLEGYMKEYFGQSARIVNEGISALYAFELINMIDGFLMANKPAYTTILIGINDLRRPHNCPLPYNCNTIQEIISIADSCRQQGSIPVVCTLIPAVGHNGIVYDEQIRQFNNKLKSECNALGIEIIDLYSAFAKYSGNIEELYDDDIHPNISGNEFIASIIYNYFKNRIYTYSQVFYNKISPERKYIINLRKLK